VCSLNAHYTQAMNFAQFLERWKTQQKITTTTDLFQELGGERELGIKLRQFREIESGKTAPSTPLLIMLFDRLHGSEKKDLIVAFMESLTELKGRKKGKAILEYLQQSLIPPLEKTSNSLWDSGLAHMTYSAEQLEFLSSNTDAMRLHKKVLLLDKLPLSRSNVKKADLQRLKELELVDFDAKNIFPSRIAYRIPNYKDSSARLVAKASDYIMKHVDVYISKEGSEKQQLAYALQMVDKTAAPRILEQIESFKKWVQSLASRDSGENVVPIIFLGFAKQLEEREL